jgi:hypothetical protein
MIDLFKPGNKSSIEDVMEANLKALRAVVFYGLTAEALHAALLMLRDMITETLNKIESETNE